MDTLERKKIVSSTNPSSKEIIKKAHEQYLEKYRKQCKKAIEDKKNSNAKKTPTPEVILTLRRIEQWEKNIQEMEEKKSQKNIQKPSSSLIWSNEDHIEGFKQQDQIFSTREKRQNENGLIITTRQYRERFRKTS
ncbi:MAG: hypothetical protein ACOZAR_00280 [Patescibacteria group bacterium]